MQGKTTSGLLVDALYNHMVMVQYYMEQKDLVSNHHFNNSLVSVQLDYIFYFNRRT